MYASTSCTSDTYAGPGEYSEPEIKNEKWVVDTFPNIKFANNIHSFGGYFMWAPGSYKNDGFRTTAPAPNIGIEKYFFEAGEKILARIKEHRNTVILPERTGPIADVLYSAAGNSAVINQAHPMLDARPPVWNLCEVIPAQLLLLLEAERAVIG